MGYYFRGELIILNGSVLQPDSLNGIRVHTEKAKFLGRITRASRKSLTLSLDENLLQAERANVTLEFLAELVLKIEDSEGQMVIIVPENRFVGQIEQINTQLRAFGVPGVSMFAKMFQSPFSKNYMELFRQKKQAHLERLKLGERQFHEHRLG